MASSGPLARVPRQTSLDPSAAHGDWTPADATVGGSSAGGNAAGSAVLGHPAGDLLVRPAPVTTGIPERSVAGRGRSAGSADDQAPDGTLGPRTGRAAMRAERQAADMARRKADKRNGGPASALPDEDGDGARRPRGVLKGLAAMAVVGLGVLGVYTWAAPVPQDAAAQSSSIAGTAPSAAPLSQLPPLPAEPVAAEPTVAAPVRVPVTVLNATDIDGLAGKISAAVVEAGWESPGVGAYEGEDVAVSTVFFTEGDENQRQAALQLIEQFPQLSGPAPRFFELPADVTVPGLVVVAAGEWVP